MIVALTLVALAVLLLIRMPVAFAMGVSGAIGLFLIGGTPMVLSIIGTAPMASATTYELMTIPMFLLMAQLVIASGYADNLFEALNSWVGNLPGGLGVATIATGAGFAAITGSSVGSAATLAGTAVPQMIDKGYSPRLSSGLVATVGTLAILIPPSNALIIYGLITGASVANLLIAGIVPGILAALALVGALQASLVKDRRRTGQTVTNESTSVTTKIAHLKTVGPIIVLFVLVTGVIFLGIGTPVEAASLGAFGALLLVAWNRRLTLSVVKEALFATARVTAMITFIIAGAHIFGYFFTLTGVTQGAVTELTSWQVSRWFILILILLVYLVLGLFMDQIAILVLTLPVTLPIVEQLGFDPIWFGIIIVITAEIGLITPPLGLNVFVVSKYTKRPLGEVFRGVVPFGLAMLVVLAILVAIPEISLWLPSLMST